METKLKNLIKEAVAEVLTEFASVNAQTSVYGVTSDKKEDKEKDPIQPGILIGPSGFSLR